MNAPRIPLSEQIAELAEAVNGLAERLDRLVEVGRIDKAAADLKVLRLRRALDTLLWVQNNAEDFVAISQAKKRLREDYRQAAGTAAAAGEGPG